MKLLEAIKVLKMDQYKMDGELGEAISVVINAYEEKNPVFSLTIMEQIVFDGFKTGLKKNKILARQLGISHYSVKKHLTKIYKKFGVNGRYELDALINK